jgi:Interferon-induced transmembrane protein
MTNPYPPYPEESGQQPGQYGYGQPQYGAPQYGAPQYGQPQYAPPPENYLVWGILTTILCCLPFGVVSIVKANQVNTLWLQGFHQEARKAAEEAKKWAIWAAASWGIVIALYLIAMLVIFLIFGVSIASMLP